MYIYAYVEGLINVSLFSVVVVTICYLYSIVYVTYDSIWSRSSRVKVDAVCLVT